MKFIFPQNYNFKNKLFGFWIIQLFFKFNLVFIYFFINKFIFNNINIKNIFIYYFLFSSFSI